MCDAKLAAFSSVRQALVGFFLAISAVACGSAEPPKNGEVDFAFAGVNAANRCDADEASPGSIVLDSFDGSVRAEISFAELLCAARVRRELPGGHYAISFRAPPPTGAATSGSSWRVQSPWVVTVLAGHATSLRLNTPSRPLAEAIAARFEPRR